MTTLYNLQGLSDFNIVILDTYMLPLGSYRVPLGNYMDPSVYVDQNMYKQCMRFSDSFSHGERIMTLFCYFYNTSSTYICCDIQI